MIKFLGTSEGHQGKRDQRKEPNLQHKVSFALADLPAVVQLVLNKSETPHISASLKFDTIQAMVRQFRQTLDFQELWPGVLGAFGPVGVYKKKLSDNMN